jgi:oligoendopeptidase F
VARVGLPAGVDSRSLPQYGFVLMATTEQSSAAGVRWNLSLLVADAETARATLSDCVVASRALEARVARIDELDAAGVRALLDEASSLAGLREVFHDEYGYAALRLLADASDTEARDLIAECGDAIATVRDGLRALSLAVGTRPALTAAPELEPYRHWLEHQAALAAARLDPSAERAFAARTPTAAGAWGRLSQEILTAASVPFDAGSREEPHGVVELRLLRLHADRAVRRRADEALLGIYEANQQVAAACLDAVVADRLAEDRLRGRDDPMAATLAVDEVDAATVELLLSAVESRTDILTRWFERKRIALGLEQIERFDRIAPVGDPPPISWPDAVDTTCRVFDELSPRLGEVARGIFADSRVDAERRPGKDGAIFCAGFPREHGVFVFLSYIESASGATMLGHELGHGVHFAVAAAARPWLSAFEPETAAFFEVPSTFAELTTAEHLFTTIGGEGGKALLRSALEGIFQLVYGATVMTRFEQDACARRASGQVLTPERIAEMWRDRDEALYGRLARPLGVMNAPHAFIARFYGYQYTYATLAALGLSVLRRADPEAFARAYVEMLEATGTGTPAQLLAHCGLDVDDPDVWQQSLAELDRLCDLAW